MYSNIILLFWVRHKASAIFWLKGNCCPQGTDVANPSEATSWALQGQHWILVWVAPPSDLPETGPQEVHFWVIYGSIEKGIKYKLKDWHFFMKFGAGLVFKGLYTASFILRGWGTSGKTLWENCVPYSETIFFWFFFKDWDAIFPDNFKDCWNLPTQRLQFKLKYP